MISGKREGALAAPSPKRKRLIAGFATQRCRGFDQQSENCRPIVIGQFDQARFRNQATQFDQLPRALAALQDPGSLVVTRDLRLQPVARCLRPVQCEDRSCQRLEHRAALSERRPSHACASPP